MGRNRKAVSFAAMILVAACTPSGDRNPPPEAGEGLSITVVEATRTTTPTSVSTPSPSPTAGFRSDGLFVLDTRTGAAEQLVGGARLHEPDRSPEGSRLAYQGDAPDGTSQIFLVEDGMSRQISHLRGGAFEPVWSPDGSRIAFAGRRAPGDADIFVLDVATGRVRLLASTRRDDRRPDWSPDGSRIVFDTFSWIWVASVDGGRPVRLGPRRITAAHGPAADATWSPDGRWIVFSRFSPGSINGEHVYALLFLMRSNGDRETSLTRVSDRNGTYEFEPTWSPRGTEVAFVDGHAGVGIVDMRTRQVMYVETAPEVSDLSWDREGLLVSIGDWARPSPDPWHRMPSW